MPQPNWIVTVGLAKEVTWGTPVTPPTTFLSSPTPTFTEKQDNIFDKGLRGIRSETQALTFGAGHTEVNIPDMPWYGDDSPNLLMGLLGTDTLSGSARTGTISAAAAGATTLTYTVLTGTAPLVGDNIKIDAGTATAEIVIVTAVSGAGPYTLTVAATKFAHAAAAPATILYGHTLTLLNTGQPPSYTLAKYDALQGSNARQIAGVYFEQVTLKFTNPGKFTVAATGKGKMGTNVAKGTSAYSAEAFNVPWQAAFTIAGISNARVIDFEIVIKAPVDLIFGMNATQSPTAAVSDQVTVTGKATVVPDDYTEYNYYLNNSQPSCVIVLDNGSTRSTFQMSKCAFIDPTVLEHNGNYTKLSSSFEAISNSTDAGTGNAPLKATVFNAKSTAY